MARKAIAQEECIFCGEHPCSCVTVSRAKLLRDKHATDRTGAPDEPESRPEITDD